jgi:SAM-dependent methyltransferase
MITREIEAIRQRYSRRSNEIDAQRYSLLNPSVYMAQQEKERALIHWVHEARLAPLHTRKLLEVGCGTGGNLLEFVRLGFAPENLVGNELLPDRAATARARLPAATAVIEGDAATLDLPNASFDIVFQSTVFSSILDREFQQRLADRMWQLARPGGGILWYDFTFDNPSNPDVRGVSLTRVCALFQNHTIRSWRITLAPPLARCVVRLHPRLYNLANIPPLRTHCLVWIAKP